LGAHAARGARSWLLLLGGQEFWREPRHLADDDFNRRNGFFFGYVRRPGA